MAELLYKVKRLEHIKLVIVFVALNILDAILTDIALNAGGIEFNPIMRPLWEQARWIAWSVEIGSTLVVALAFILLAIYAPRLTKVFLIVSIVYMAAVCIYNGAVLFT
jgi:hypothetical protein